MRNYGRAAALCNTSLEKEFKLGWRGYGGLPAACAYHAYRQLGDDDGADDVVRLLKRRVKRRDDITRFLAAADGTTESFFAYFVDSAKAESQLSSEIARSKK